MNRYLIDTDVHIDHLRGNGKARDYLRRLVIESLPGHLPPEKASQKRLLIYTTPLSEPRSFDLRPGIALVMG